MMDDKIVYALIFCTMLFLFLFAVIVIVFFVSGRQKMKQQVLLSQTMLAYEKELREIEAEVSEHIAGHIGRELHDSVGALHTAMRFQLANIKLDHPDLSDKFHVLETTLAEAGDQIRSLGRTLNGDYIRANGLADALQTEVRRIKSLAKFEVHLQLSGSDSPLNKNGEIIVLRIFQEFSSNTLKHADAHNLFVRVDMSSSSFGAEFRDDGIGFEMSAITGTGFASGLRNMQKRAEMADLEFVFESVPGGGTRLSLRRVSEIKR